MTHTHHHDPISGWCACGYREDGRLMKSATIVRPGPRIHPRRTRSHPTESASTMTTTPTPTITRDDAESALADLVAGAIDAIDARTVGADDIAGAIALDLATRMVSMSHDALFTTLAVAVEHLAIEMRA